MTLPTAMRYIDSPSPGGPEVLRLASGPVPRPGLGEVLIRVEAAGINRADMLQRQGRYPPHLALLPSSVWRSQDTSSNLVPAQANGGRWAIPPAPCLPAEDTPNIARYPKDSAWLCLPVSRFETQPLFPRHASRFGLICLSRDGFFPAASFLFKVDRAASAAWPSRWPGVRCSRFYYRWLG
jgi:hypothetical protein